MFRNLFLGVYNQYEKNCLSVCVGILPVGCVIRILYTILFVLFFRFVLYSSKGNKNKNLPFPSTCKWKLSFFQKHFSVKIQYWILFLIHTHTHTHTYIQIFWFIYKYVHKSRTFYKSNSKKKSIIQWWNGITKYRIHDYIHTHTIYTHTYI